MKKVLLTSGCSFTQGPHSWPNYLSEALQLQLINYGQSSRGNGYISRSAIYGLSELLENYKSQDIIVGIMWSGPDRHEFYNKDISKETIDRSSINPHSFIPKSPNYWVGLNHHWNDETSKLYYKYFYHEIAGFIYTLENILRLQWLLKLYKIDYFMTIYSDIVFPKNQMLDILDIKHLYQMIDFSKFVNIKSCIDWCYEDSMIPMSHEPEHLSRYSAHPSKKHHQAFAEKVLVPFINKNIYPCKEGERR